MNSKFNVRDMLTTAIMTGITEDEEDSEYVEITPKDFQKISIEYDKLYSALIMELSELLLAIALGSCDYIYKYIEEEFKSNEIEYYRSINDNRYYKYNPFKGYMLKESEMMRKALGIIMYEKKKSQDFEKSHYLIMKGYKHLWNDMKYYKNNLDKTLDLNEYMKKLAISDKSSEYELQMAISVILYLYKTTKLENISLDLFVDDGMDVVRTFLSKLSVELPQIFPKFLKEAKGLDIKVNEMPYIKFIQEKMDENNISSIKKDDFFRDIQENIFAHQKNVNYDYIKKEKFETKIANHFERIVNKFFKENEEEISRLEDIHPLEILNKPHLVPEELMALADEKHKMIVSTEKKVETINNLYSRVLYRLGLSSDSLDYHFNVTKSDINKIAHIAKMSLLEIQENIPFNQETRELFYESIVYLYILSQNIISTKEEYLKNMNDDYINNLEIYEEKLKSKENKISSIEKKLKIKKDSLEKKEKEYLNTIKTLKEKVKDLEKNNSKLANENKEIKENKKELVALREHFFELEESEIPTKLDLEDMKNKINALNSTIAIIGGHPNWVKKIKKELHNIEYIPITKNISEDLIKSSQYIIINRDHNKHSVYKKIIQNISEDCNLSYMSNVTNTDMSIKKIYNNIFKED